jgi:predicted DNA-binding transcriptional regulator AlpA
VTDENEKKTRPTKINLLPDQKRLLRLAEVEYITGYKHTKIYDEMAAGRFPLPLRRAKFARWFSDEIDAYERMRAERDQTEAA